MLMSSAHLGTSDTSNYWTGHTYGEGGRVSPVLLWLHNITRTVVGKYTIVHRHSGRVVNVHGSASEMATRIEVEAEEIT